MTEKVKVFEQGTAKKATPFWLWLLPLLLLLAIGIWLLNRHHNDASTAPVVAGDSTKPDVTPGTTTAGSVWTAANISDALRQNGHVAFNDSEVHFATASASLAGDSQAVLDQTAEALKENGPWHIRVVGHTDSTGSSAQNDVLAQQRSESVKSYLVAHGVDQSRLDVQAKGSSQPAATNGTDTGRAENRRVELFKE